MQYKTIVHRTMKHIVLDPEKINASYSRVEAEQYVGPTERTAIDVAFTVDDEGNKEEMDFQEKPMDELQTCPYCAEVLEDPENHDCPAAIDEDEDFGGGPNW